MKKLLLCAAIAVFGLSNVNAQGEATTGGFAKGDVYASGMLNFGSSKQGDSKINGFGIMPCVGIFISDNVAVGAQLGYDSSKGEFGSTTTSELSEFSVGAYAKYFFSPANQFSFYGKVGLDYTTEEDKLSDVKYNGFDIAVMPGFNYFLSECIAIHATFGSLGYSSLKADTSGAEANNSFGLNLDMKDIGFGVIYKF